jgi:hypothetical protein
LRLQAAVEERLELVLQLWTSNHSDYQPQLTLVELLHLATNTQAAAPVNTLFEFVRWQRWQVQDLLQQLLQLGHEVPQSQQQQLLKLAAGEGSNFNFDQQQPQQQAGRMTRCKSRSKQQLLQQLDDLQQHLERFEQQLQGAELGQLLGTAVARMHSRVVNALCALPAAAELPSAAIVQLLQRCIVHKAPSECVLQSLLKLAAAVDTEAAAAAAAAEADSDAAAAAAEGLVTTAQQLVLAPVQLQQLLQYAAEHRNSYAVQQLVTCNAVQQLDVAALQYAACTAIMLRDSSSLTALCRLPQMQSVPRLADELLACAVLHRSYICVRQLRLHLPSARTLRHETFFQLLHMSLQAGAKLASEVLSFPAVHKVSVREAEGLLLVALKSPAADATACQRNAVLRALLTQLPAAAHISRASLTLAMHYAIAHGPRSVGVDALEQLCQLPPAASQLQAADVLPLLDKAIFLDSPWAVSLLCQLPAAQQLPPDDLGHVLRGVLQSRRRGSGSLVQQLCAELATQAQQLDAYMVRITASSGVVACVSCRQSSGWPTSCAHACTLKR